jgi:glc operon protein GlcG
VADPHGELVAFLRTDGCRPSAVTLAMNKAFTAAREHMPTAELGPALAAKGFPLTNFGDLRFLSFPGGVPIVVDGEVVGAVAVSGLPDQEDIDLAHLGAQVITG